MISIEAKVATKQESQQHLLHPWYLVEGASFRAGRRQGMPRWQSVLTPLATDTACGVCPGRTSSEQAVVAAAPVYLTFRCGEGQTQGIIRHWEARAESLHRGPPIRDWYLHFTTP